MACLPLLGHTPLIIGAEVGILEIVQYLVGKKANIEAKDSRGGCARSSISSSSGS